MQNIFFIIDFDSTFVTLEALDELAKIALKDSAKQNSIVKEIQHITTLGMEGKISFRESLSRRLALFSANNAHITKLIHVLQKHITPSFTQNKSFFQKYADRIYIISGGFKECIYPVVKSFGIPESHVLANTFTFDQLGNITGFDTTNPLSDKGGKVTTTLSLQLPGDLFVIGDGFSDYEIKEAGLANTFFAFTENVQRQSVIAQADHIVQNFDQVLSLLAGYYPEPGLASEPEII